MNIYYLFEKKDNRLKISGTVSPTTKDINGQRWRGLLMQPGAKITIENFLEYYPFRYQPDVVGWKYCLANNLLNITKRKSQLRVAIKSKALEWVRKVWVHNISGDIYLPWPISPLSLSDQSNLELFVPADMPAAVFLAVHRILEREHIISLCVGDGIEIGPGPRPQILPSDKVNVSYLEQKLPHEWAELYGNDYATPVDSNLWKMFIVGDADNLPVEPHSLDFIFSSHVFEHLANPLGHLELWLEKLRPGGKIIAIIPDISGSKDQRAEPSGLDMILREYRSEIFKPSMEHYEYFLSIRKNVKDSAKTFMQKGRSIHVHYYDNRNISIIMNEARKRFDFKGYSIVHSKNHKDFYLIIEK